VEERWWHTEPCPVCGAAKRNACRSRSGRQRQAPHEERITLIINSPRHSRRRRKQERQNAIETTAPTWKVTDVACPECGAQRGSGCTPNGTPHPARQSRFRLRFPSH
jgi:hypothetical protein